MDDFEPKDEYINNMPIFKIEESDSDEDSEEITLLPESPKPPSKIKRMCNFISSAFKRNKRKKKKPSASIIDNTMI